MNTLKNELPTNDPELEALLDLVRETPMRDPRVVARGRAKYISDVDKIIAPSSMLPSSWLANLFGFGWLGENRGYAGLRRSMKLSYSILLVALVVVTILFSSAGATAYAAQSALPGDALYPVKTKIEQTRVKLAADAARVAELHLEFAERRLDEIAGLIAEGRYEDIERATQEFEDHVQQALVAMQTVAAGDPLRAQELAKRVTAALSEYGRTLSSMMVNVPEDTRASMERAIITSQSARDEYNETNVNLDDHENSLTPLYQKENFLNEKEGNSGEDVNNLVPDDTAEQNNNQEGGSSDEGNNSSLDQDDAHDQGDGEDESRDENRDGHNNDDDGGNEHDGDHSSND